MSKCSATLASVAAPPPGARQGFGGPSCLRQCQGMHKVCGSIFGANPSETKSRYPRLQVTSYIICGPSCLKLCDAIELQPRCWVRDGEGCKTIPVFGFPKLQMTTQSLSPDQCTCAEGPLPQAQGEFHTRTPNIILGISSWRSLRPWI